MIHINICSLRIVYINVTNFIGSGMSVVNISENEVKELLDWPSLCEAIEQSLRGVCEIRTSDDQPNCQQPTRIFTPALNGMGNLLIFGVIDSN